MFIKPRTKGKIKADITLKDAYLLFKKEYPEVEIKQTKYSKICKQYNQQVVELMVNKAFIYDIPYKMGKIYIRKYKLKYKVDNNGKLITKNKPINYKATKELWEKNLEAKEKHIKIYQTNQHSDGYKMGFYWNKSGCRIKSLGIYHFKPTRTQSRYLAKQIKTQEELNFLL